MKIFKLPDLGEGLPDAIIREWYVTQGETIKQDQPMVAMETAKALVDVPAPFSGVVEKLFGDIGDTIDTGSALIGFEGEGEAEQNQDAGTVVGSIEESSSNIFETSSTSQHGSAGQSNTAKATPAVRVLAKQLGVDLNSITPQGSHISAEEVKRAANISNANVANIQLEGELTKLSGVRRAMAQSMVQSHQTVVPATIMGEADLFNWDDKQDVTLRIIRAMQAACEQEPMLNCFYDGGQMAYQTNDSINLGVAVDTKHGLFVPVLKDIAKQDDKSLRAEINSFKEHALERSFPKEMLQGATIIMSNVGAIAGSYASPVIIPPMVAIVAFGRAKATLIQKEGNLETHRLLPISITFDHRPVTGGDAARFLKVLIESLEK